MSKETDYLHAKFDREDLLKGFHEDKEEFDLDNIIGSEGLEPKPSYNVIYKEEKIGFLISIPMHDQGNMDKEKVLGKGQTPAHVHITELNPKIILARLNITGPCPKDGNDINQHYEKIPKNNRDKPMNGKIKTAIAEWANEKSKNKFNDNKLDTNWVCMQDLWINIKESQKDHSNNKEKK